jgi:hypothetical protein
LLRSTPDFEGFRPRGPRGIGGLQVRSANIETENVHDRDELSGPVDQCTTVRKPAAAAGSRAGVPMIVDIAPNLMMR